MTAHLGVRTAQLSPQGRLDVILYICFSVFLQLLKFLLLI